jgi:hypothetical protein
LCVFDTDKADKLKQSLPPGLTVQDLWWELSSFSAVSTWIGDLSSSTFEENLLVVSSMERELFELWCIGTCFLSFFLW